MCRLCLQACMSLPVDLICLDLAKRLPFRLKPPLLQAAVARGVHFEARVILLHTCDVPGHCQRCSVSEAQLHASKWQRPVFACR